MNTRITAAALAVASFLLPSTLLAQSSAIGFSGAELSLGHINGDSGSLTTLDANADFAITAQHGFQLDVTVVDYGATWFGAIAGHLYLQPTRHAKYGVFFAYADANDIEAATFDAGVEGIWSLGTATTLTARAGLGRADPSEVDYIFASLGARQALTDQLSLTGSIALLDADEARASFTAATYDLGLAYALPSAPIEAYIGASHTRISGSLATAETRLAIGLTARIGGPRTARAAAAARSFAPVRPLRPLLERNMVWDFVANR
ncbi:MAG: hypothetical protein JXQ91_03335 [Vannielia sp.]|uniref:hypothetical protein n=1 Tax=Vannielia sp. TaxID=2813045 RepID=UPI003B8D4741